MSPEDRTAPRILYLSRDGILDGLGQSQIVAYLRALAPSHRFWLVTFEKSLEGSEALRRDLAARGIGWIPLRFHGRTAPWRAAWGLVKFVLVAWRLVVVRRLAVIHARSYVPCLAAMLVRLLCLGYPRVIFDMRGFWVDERAEAAGWGPERAAYRAGKWLERLLLRHASAVVTLTDAAREEVERLIGRGAQPASVTVIPTCVDTERFRRHDEGAVPPGVDPAWRDRLVLVYTGAAGFWQNPDTLAEFFAVAGQERPDAVFLCLMRTGGDKMRAALARANLAGSSRVVEGVPPRDLPVWLSVGSVGVVWYRPTFSRIGNYPTKLGEYLACGLPVVVAGATADSAGLVRRERVGTVVRDFSPAAYREALAEVLTLMKDPETPPRCRRAAERELAVEVGSARYAGVYQRLRGSVA